MALRDLFKISRKTFFNPRAWFDYDTFRLQNETIKDVLQPTFSIPKPVREETFAQAMKRLNLTESDVKIMIRDYRRYAMLFLVLGIGVILYSFYLLFRYATFVGLLLGLASAALFFAQAFKYDFWSLQMRKRKLGLTFDDWKQSVLGKKGHS